MSKMISSKFEGYTWYHFPLQVHLIKVLESFPRIPRFRFRYKGQKHKRGVGGSFFTKCFIASYTSLTSRKGLAKLLEYTGLFHSLVRICCYVEKRSHYFCPSLKKTVKLRKI